MVSLILEITVAQEFAQKVIGQLLGAKDLSVRSWPILLKNSVLPM